MRNLKKFLALVLAMMMVFSLMITANAATAATTSDDGTAYQTAYDTLKTYGVVKGTDEAGTDDLDKPFSRAQVALIVYKIMTGDTDETQYELQDLYAADYFPDMKDAAWARGAVGFCVNAGIVIGDDNGNFRPNDPVTGYEVAVFMLKMLGYGRNGEFTGKNWAVNGGSEAIRVGINKGLLSDVSLSKVVNRGIAIQMAYNAATVAKPVEYSSGSYKAADKALITATPVETSRVDEWGGIWKTTYTNVSFNWKVTPVEKKEVGKVEVDLAKGEWYEAVNECDVAEKVGITTSKTYDVIYLNGLLQDDKPHTPMASKQVIQATDTVNKIGAQGQWTRVYDAVTVNGTSYTARIVYVNFYLADVTDVVSKVVDEQDHTVKADTAYITIYNGTAWSNSSILSDKYNRGDVAMVTVKDTLNEKDQLVTVGTAGIAPANVITNTLLDYDVVTVEAINYSDAFKTVALAYGFDGEDGVTYSYANTYAGDAATGDFGGGEKGFVSKIGDPGITRDFAVWTNPVADNGTVLGVFPLDDVGVGVVTNFSARNTGSAKYVLDLEVYTMSGETVTISTKNDDGNFFGNSLAAENYGKDLLRGEFNTGDDVLVIFAVENDGYYSVIPGRFSSASTKLDEGDVDGFARDGGHFIDDDTLFFIAQYKLTNSKEGYVTTGYKVVKGFKNIEDLSIHTVGARDKIDGEIRNQLRFHWFRSADGTVSYAVVLYATEVADNDVNKNLPGFAFLLDGDQFVKVHDGYNTYTAIIDGEDGQVIDVNYTNAPEFDGTPRVFRRGLYMLGDKNKNDGHYKTVEMSGSPAQDLPANTIMGIVESNAVFGRNYLYQSGVFYTQYLNLRGSGVEPGPLQFITVSDDVEVFVVNPTKGTSAYAGGIENLSGLTRTDVYGYNEIWFQVDEFGWARYIYIVANDADDIIYDANLVLAGFTTFPTVYNAKGEAIKEKTATTAGYVKEEYFTLAAQRYTTENVKAPSTVKYYIPTTLAPGTPLVGAKVYGIDMKVISTKDTLKEFWTLGLNAIEINVNPEFKSDAVVIKPGYLDEWKETLEKHTLFLMGSLIKNGDKTVKPDDKGDKTLNTGADVNVWIEKENHFYNCKEDIYIPAPDGLDHDGLVKTALTVTEGDDVHISFNWPATSSFNNDTVYFWIDGVKVQFDAADGVGNIRFKMGKTNVTLNTAVSGDASAELEFYNAAGTTEYKRLRRVDFDHKYLSVVPTSDATECHSDADGVIYVQEGPAVKITISGVNGYTGRYKVTSDGKFVTSSIEVTTGDLAYTSGNTLGIDREITGVTSNLNINAIAKLNINGAARASYKDSAGTHNVGTGNWVIIDTPLTVTASRNDVGVIDKDCDAASLTDSTDYKMPAVNTTLYPARQIVYNPEEIRVTIGTGPSAVVVPSGWYVRNGQQLVITPVNTANTDLRVIAVNNVNTAVATATGSTDARLAVSGVYKVADTTGSKTVWLKLAVTVSAGTGTAGSTFELRLKNGDGSSELLANTFTASNPMAYAVSGTELVVRADGKSVLVTGATEANDNNGVVTFTVGTATVVIRLS